MRNLHASQTLGKVVYYKSRKRELKRRLINEGRSDERLKDRVQEATFLTYTGFCLFIMNQ